MRKFGYFFAAFLPVLLALGLQFIATFFMMGVAGLSLVLSGQSFGMEALSNMMLEDQNFNYVTMMVFSILCSMIFSLWYYYSCGGDFLPKLSETFSGMQLAGVIVIIPGAQFACALIMGVISIVMPSWMEQYESLIENAGLGDTNTLPMLLYAVLLAPIGEELIFRGVTMRLARQALPFWLANLMQAALFGAFHMNWMQGCYAFALGFLLGFICEKGGSIYYSILMHMLFNIWGTIISPLLSGAENMVALGLIIILTTILSLGLGLFLFIFGIRRRKEKIAVMHSLHPLKDF
ncbi:MAG: CPBP family intramembrane metalloprotease [Muribaculaceae bacterium]|nr:CPBP family intramembrane metalloprotease [Roseburia sp.]MCM1430116.1 CPBP family intramembrane metalloprotease [Muribaculaceae bacterium]MCM1492181.1 CPBP family intramembrane metalloprotease [Muribaculaceae bacterium]